MKQLRRFWQSVRRGADGETAAASPPRSQVAMLDLDVAANDPLALYFQTSPGVVDVERLDLESPVLASLREAGVKLVVPLVSQGELIGMINLGPRLSEQDYSTDDRKLLSDLATQAAPAVRVAQLARQQQAEARERERMEQELRVARLIQQTLLPHELPNLPGYEIAAYYRPAREVGGDFYDFLYFEDGQVGLIIGDVTDKGVPAALVMATTRTLLRAGAERLINPSAVLERVNELLHPDIPQRMFVTCLYALLDPASGRLRYANAGHDLPYRRHQDGVDELRATGMPLGLMPGMTYEEKEVMLAPGDTVLFHSDGLVEAHNVQGDMFGFPRLQEMMGLQPEDDSRSVIEYLLQALADFTGDAWEQEDDVTLVTLRRGGAIALKEEPQMDEERAEAESDDRELWQRDWEMLAEFELPSEPGNERKAMEDVAEIVQGLSISPARMEKLKTAVAEATMNAMEHGNQYRADVPVQIQVMTVDGALAVRITDRGGGQPIPEAEQPDLEAKLSGMQSPRGWGLFLIESMVDEMNVLTDDVQHTVELIMHLEEGGA
jgi:serine phosphatase RsbU (regulator of sigma subunit)/anti-sigma regulatory factor (Ser/Thr protein kinase)